MNTREIIGFNANAKEEVNSQPKEIVQHNNYLETMIKAFDEFVKEEAMGNCFTLARFEEKINAGRLLFDADRKNLSNTLKQMKL